MRKISIVILILLPLLVASCSLVSSLKDTEHEEVKLAFPQWPQTLPPLVCWKVECYKGENGSHVVSQYPPDSKSFSLRVRKNTPFYICATPVTGTQTQPQEFFKCAGAVYPWSLELSWSGGYSANLMRTLVLGMEKSGWSASYICANLCQFNWYKLNQVLEQKQQDSLEEGIFYNPWLLDSQKVLEAIAYKDFTATKLRQSGVFSANLEFCVYSSYVPENQVCCSKEKAGCVTVKKDEPLLVAVPAESQEYGIILYGSSEKNISLEFISLPIYIEGI